MKTMTTLILAAALTLAAAPAWADICDVAVFALDGQIKGTHYDAAGNATKVKCDTKAGDLISVNIVGIGPRFIGVSLTSNSPECGTDVENDLSGGWALPVAGTEVQVVKNGKAKNQCVLHAAAEGAADADPSTVGWWTIHTLRKYYGSGQPRVENGDFSYSTENGRVFVGKIKIRYP